MNKQDKRKSNKVLLSRNWLGFEGRTKGQEELRGRNRTTR